MDVKYEIYDLGGNPTAVILADLSKSDGLAAQREIMQEHPDIEQVALIQKTEGETCHFRMAGGEFCGNAIRAVAGYMHRNHNAPESKIIINGINVHAKAILGPGLTPGNEITIDKDILLKEVKKIDGKTVVILNGITHVIIDDPDVDGDSVARIKNDFNRKGITAEAFGVMLLNGEDLNPYVWVESAQTFFNETACLSGSIAVALHRGTEKCTVIQPTGAPYTITITPTQITASGPIQYLDTGTIKI